MKKTKRIANSNHGFTFIELILYMALVAMMLSYLAPLAWNMILGNTKVVSQQELSTQARYTSERIKQEIRNASGINIVSGTGISLSSTDSSKNPIIISRDVATNTMRIKLGAAPYVNINSDDTSVTAATFTNYSTTANTTSKHIGFTFTMTTNYGSQRKEYFQTVDIRSSAEVRSN